jgi:predicted nucleic acid-binding protein
MKYMIDSTVMVKWVLPETDSDKAVRLRDDFRQSVHELLSPDIFAVEACHALTRAERQLRIAPGDARVLFLDILTTPPRVFAFQPLLLRALDISSSMRIGVYDCIYVALAEQEHCDVVTADTTMVRTLQPAFPFIHSLSSLPRARRQNPLTASGGGNAARCRAVFANLTALDDAVGELDAPFPDRQTALERGLAAGRCKGEHGQCMLPPFISSQFESHNIN